MLRGQLADSLNFSAVLRGRASRTSCGLGSACTKPPTFLGNEAWGTLRDYCVTRRSCGTHHFATLNYKLCCIEPRSDRRQDRKGTMESRTEQHGNRNDPAGWGA